MCVLIYYKTSVLNVYHFKKICEKYSIKNFMKICPVGAEFFHVDGRTDGQTDMTKLIVAFLRFCERA